MSPVRSSIPLLIGTTWISLGLGLLTIMLSRTFLGTFVATLLLTLTATPTAILSMIANLTLCSDRVAFRARQPAIISITLFMVAFLSLVTLGILSTENSSGAIQLIRRGAIVMAGSSHVVFLLALHRLLPPPVSTSALKSTSISFAAFAFIVLLNWISVLQWESSLTGYSLSLLLVAWACSYHVFLRQVQAAYS